MTDFDDELKQFVKDMHDTMDDYNGIGLAANQVGEAKRVITILFLMRKMRKSKRKSTGTIKGIPSLILR